jgi:hypothetical protein
MIASEGYDAALLAGFFSFLLAVAECGVIIATIGPFGENGSAWL